MPLVDRKPTATNTQIQIVNIPIRFEYRLILGVFFPVELYDWLAMNLKFRNILKCWRESS